MTECSRQMQLVKYRQASTWTGLELEGRIARGGVQKPLCSFRLRAWRNSILESASGQGLSSAAHFGRSESAAVVARRGATGLAAEW